MSAALYTHRFLNQQFTVYPDRIELQVGRAAPTILYLARVATVDAPRSPNRVRLVTTDGATHSYAIGLPSDTQAAAQAIQAALAALAPDTVEPAQTQIKEYRTAQEFEADVARMQAGGWRLEDQIAQTGHINVGRTATGMVLTGGLSLLLGASRTHDKITVTWVRGGGTAMKTCPQCAESVKAAARVCRFCQYAFPAEAAP